MFCRVREKSDSREFYIHEIYIEDEVKEDGDADSLLQGMPVDADPVPRRNGGNPADLYKSILKKALFVNTDSVSKIVEYSLPRHFHYRLLH